LFNTSIIPVLPKNYKYTGIIKISVIYRYLTSNTDIHQRFLEYRYYQNKGMYDTGIQLLAKLFRYSVPGLYIQNRY